MEFSRQEYWSGFAISFSRGSDLPDPGIEPGSPALRADALPSEPQKKVGPFYLAVEGKNKLWSIHNAKVT